MSRLFPKGGLVFEIGACIGDMVEGLLQHGAGWVVAIEPEAEDIAHMRKRFRNKDNVIIEPQAVGPEVGNGIISISRGSRSCTTFVPDVAWGEDTLLRGLPISERRTVPMTTLDRLIEVYGMPDFVNMTVVRFEYQALCGLSKSLPYLAFAVTHDTIKEGWALKAIDRIIDISPASSFNYTERDALINNELAPLHFPTWVGAEGIKRLLPTIDCLGLWGRIHTRML